MSASLDDNAVTRPIRVLDLRSSGWVDGPGRTVLDTASSIDCTRCEIVVGGFVDDRDSGSEYVEEAKKRGLQVEVIRESGSLDIRVIKQVLGIIARQSIDIIHTHDFRSNLLGLYCAKRLGLPIVTTCHGWIANNLKGRLYTSIDRFLLRYFDRIIVVSKAMKDQLLARGISESHIAVIQNALIVENFQPCPGNQAFREELGLKSSTRIISNIGRLSPEKGQRQFILAARELVKVFHDIHFVLVGAGKDEKTLRELVRSSNLSNHVSFVGHRTDMDVVYNGTDLVVQSSWTEGMPNVVLEALLMETPVVATGVGGTNEILNNAYGEVIQPGSTEELKKAVAGFMCDPERLQGMAKRGRRSIIRKFDHEKRVVALTRVYEETRATRV